jgi:Na+/H+ antiporter NhaD/arsenite permease-like protein
MQCKANVVDLTVTKSITRVHLRESVAFVVVFFFFFFFCRTKRERERRVAKEKKKKKKERIERKTVYKRIHFLESFFFSLGLRIAPSTTLTAVSNTALTPLRVTAEHSR